MSLAEIIVDTVEPKGDDIMYLLPSKLASSKYLASNTFDQATIRNCPVEKITSGGLMGIFSSLKPQGKITIIVFQPIAVMLFYDSKQIEANLKLAGFEDIHIRDINIKDEKTKKSIQTQSIEATKPLSKRGADINIEIRKSRFEESRPYNYEKKEIREEPIKNKSNITTKITTTTTTTNSGYKPRNKTYFRQEIKEEIPIEEKKSYSRKRYGAQTNENIEEERPKNRTYVRVEETNNDGKGRTGYYKRKLRFSATTNDN